MAFSAFSAFQGSVQGFISVATPMTTLGSVNANTSNPQLNVYVFTGNGSLTFSNTASGTVKYILIASGGAGSGGFYSNGVGSSGSAGASGMLLRGSLNIVPTAIDVSNTLSVNIGIGGIGTSPVLSSNYHKNKAPDGGNSFISYNNQSIIALGGTGGSTKSGGLTYTSVNGANNYGGVSSSINGGGGASAASVGGAATLTTGGLGGSSTYISLTDTNYCAGGIGGYLTLAPPTSNLVLNSGNGGNGCFTQQSTAENGSTGTAIIYWSR